MTEITQADRDAAENYHDRFCDVYSPPKGMCSCGVEQAFTKHRIQAVEQAQVEINRLREAINRDIVRFAHCTAMIEIGPQVSKTRRAEHLTEVLRFEEEAIAALTAPHSPTE